MTNIYPKLCFWCNSTKHITKDHLIPLCMGGSGGKTVPACRECNEERGRVTELYSDRIHLINYINNNPTRITSYKNRFRKKVKKMSNTILKWEILHREKGILLPHPVLVMCKLDETMPIGF